MKTDLQHPFCASEGLATGVRALVDRPVLAKPLGLKDNHVILLLAGFLLSLWMHPPGR